MRLSAIADAVQAEWPDGDTAWLVGAEHAHGEAGALNRVVVYPVGGPIGEPGIAAQGHYLSNLEPNAAAADAVARDDLLWARRPVVNWEVWGSDFADAESRLHALLAAMSEALTSTELTLSDLRETWVRQGDIASGGSMVVLSTTVTIYVLTQDITLPDVPGEGVETETVGDIEINMIHETDAEDETIVTIELSDAT